LESDKLVYKVAVAKCSSAINKYHTANELELTELKKNNVGSF